MDMVTCKLGNCYLDKISLTIIRKNAYNIKKEVAGMGLREVRRSRRLTQRELAQMSGVNFRSLQDYEQGHKKLTSANGDILLRLSTVLGCYTEELLLSDDFTGASLLPANRMAASEIQSQRFYYEKYKTAGRWVCSDTAVATMFYYEGKQYTLPFKAVFSPDVLPWLMEAAVLQMEAKIEAIHSGERMEAW